jgi:hypothetical protein
MVHTDIINLQALESANIKLYQPFAEVDEYQVLKEMKVKVSRMLSERIVKFETEAEER